MAENTTTEPADGAARKLSTYEYMVGNMPVQAQLTEAHAKRLGANRVADAPEGAGTSQVGEEQVQRENVTVKARRSTTNKARPADETK